MENLGQQPPVIIRRRKVRSHDEHGGAWKVAMADFALAMMALFLVLWIISNSSEEERKAISGYFQDPLAFSDGQLMPSASPIDLGGSPSLINNLGQDGSSDPMAQLQSNRAQSQGEGDGDGESLEALQGMLEELVTTSATLSPFRNQIRIDITSDGLRLQIVDQRERPMFEAGSARLTYYTEDILWELAPVLAQAGYQMSITGHTDAVPNNPSGRDEDNANWLLSASRADAARRALVEAGVDNDQISQVIGMAAQAPYDPDDPTAAVNRRIGLLLLSPQRQQDLQSQHGAPAPADAKADSADSGPQGSTDPASGRVQRVQQNRDRSDNQYDNPPNQFE